MFHEISNEVFVDMRCWVDTRGIHDQHDASTVCLNKIGKSGNPEKKKPEGCHHGPSQNRCNLFVGQTHLLLEIN